MSRTERWIFSYADSEDHIKEARSYEWNGRYTARPLFGSRLKVRKSWAINFALAHKDAILCLTTHKEKFHRDPVFRVFSLATLTWTVKIPISTPTRIIDVRTMFLLDDTTVVMMGRDVGDAFDPQQPSFVVVFLYATDTEFREVHYKHKPFTPADHGTDRMAFAFDSEKSVLHGMFRQVGPLDADQMPNTNTTLWKHYEWRVTKDGIDPPSAKTPRNVGKPYRNTDYDFPSVGVAFGGSVFFPSDELSPRMLIEYDIAKNHYFHVVCKKARDNQQINPDIRWVFGSHLSCYDTEKLLIRSTAVETVDESHYFHLSFYNGAGVMVSVIRAGDDTHILNDWPYVPPAVYDIPEDLTVFQYLALTYTEVPPLRSLALAVVTMQLTDDFRYYATCESVNCAKSLVEMMKHGRYVE